MELTEPCRDVYELLSPTETGDKLGSMNAELRHLNGDHLGWMCDRPGVMLSQAQLVEARVRIDLVQGLASGDYAFETVFAGSGDAGASASTFSTSEP